MKECYECGSLTDKLSPRSRCVTCEHRRAEFNEEENRRVRGDFNRMLRERNYWKREFKELENNPVRGIFK